MKQLLILAITWLPLTIKSQDKNPVQKILIGFSFSPDYSFRKLKNGDGNSSTDLVIKSRNEMEIAKFGYTTGLNVCFKFSQSVGFETGIQFSSKGYKTKDQDLVFFPPDASLPTKQQTIYAYQYIGLPLKARFSFGKNKVRFISGIGVAANFLLNVKQTFKYEYADGKTEKKSQSSKSGFRSVDISPFVSIGVDYKLNDQFLLFAEPAFRYGLIKTKDAPVTEKLWSAGLNIGFYYTPKIKRGVKYCPVN
jgi:hypothetical protein